MTKILHPGCDHCNHPMFAAMRCDVCGKVHSTDEEPQQEADGYIYEYESPFGGVHKELTCRQWNGREPCRTIPYYLHPAPSVPEGWQLVPKEPTPEMLEAVWGSKLLPDHQGSRRIASEKYKAMLSAAPKAPATDAACHASDCAVYNEPAYPSRPCDCGLNAATASQKEEKE